MSLSSSIVDLLEITAVFLLSVEAIKIKNLEWVRARAINPFLARINPKIEFVEEFSTGDTFIERRAFELFFFGTYLFGWLVLFVGLAMLDVSLSSLIPQTALGWFFSALGVVFAPILAGMITYTAFVSIVERCIRALAWVEAHTHTGAVGALGFALYLTQFAVRRVLAL